MVEVDSRSFTYRCFWSLGFILDDMTLLELYDKLCTGEIKMCNSWGYYGLCYAIKHNISIEDKWEFEDTMMHTVQWLGHRGIMTPERETFLLLFAAYKGEL